MFKLNILLSKLFFHLRKYAILLQVFFKSVSNPWKKVEDIFLPVKISIGYNTLRWILNGRYEEHEINIVKSHLEAHDVVFEIGTGLGFISSYCAKILGNNQVHTYEANKLNIPVIKNVFKKNKVAPILTNAFLAKKDGLENISFPVDRSNRLGSSSFINSKEEFSIPILDLNDEIKRIGPSFLVMDIEGGELNIFKIIQFGSIKKLQFELHPAVLDKEMCDEIFAILRKNNFEKDETLSVGQNYYFYSIN